MISLFRFKHKHILLVEGTIGDADTASLNRLFFEIESVYRPLDVIINSTGGDLDTALLIYDFLRSINRRVTVRTLCYKQAASAATVIAQGASTNFRLIVKDCSYCIHECTTTVQGYSSELRSAADLLDSSTQRLAEIYSSYSNNDANFYRQLMSKNDGNGVVQTYDEAILNGLVDYIINFKFPISVLTGCLIELLNCHDFDDKKPFK